MAQEVEYRGDPVAEGVERDEIRDDWLITEAAPLRVVPRLSVIVAHVQGRLLDAER